MFPSSFVFVTSVVSINTWSFNTSVSSVLKELSCSSEGSSGKGSSGEGSKDISLSSCNTFPVLSVIL